MQEKNIYLDNNATTKPDPEVVRAFVELSSTSFYNINTNSTEAGKVRNSIEKMSKAILKVARIFSDDYDVLYAGSSTEINKAIIAWIGSGNVVTSPYEHKSILGCCGESTFLPLDPKNGNVTPKSLAKVLKKVSGNSPKGNSPKESLLKGNSPKLVSIMAANNEFPVVNPIKELYEVVLEHNARNPGKTPVLFHTDATQLFMKTSDTFYGDLINFSTHKFGGLKGVGVLIYRKSIPGIEDLKNHMVNGTPNSVSMLANAPLFKEFLKVRSSTSGLDAYEMPFKRRHFFFETMLEANVNFVSLEPEDVEYLNPGTCLISFPGCCNLLIKQELDAREVIISIGSACDTDKRGASETIKSLGLLGNDGIIRVSFGSSTTAEELTNFVKILVEILPLCKK